MIHVYIPSAGIERKLGLDATFAGAGMRCSDWHVAACTLSTVPTNRGCMPPIIIAVVSA